MRAGPPTAKGGATDPPLAAAARAVSGSGGAGRDLKLLVLTRGLRGFGAGSLSVVFALDLAREGYSSLAIGLLVGLAMAAAALWAIAAPRMERRLARRQVLGLGALLFAAGGALLFFDLSSLITIVVALALGGIVASSSDISPLGAMEQAGLGSVSAQKDRTLWFAVYNLAGYLATAAGALAAVPLASEPLSIPWLPSGTHDSVLLLYALLGLGLLPAYLGLSQHVNEGSSERVAGLSPERRRPILELTGLFSVDAFGGGLIANTLVTAYLVERFHPAVLTIGLILAGGSVAAAASLLLAVPLARRFGLVNTMVFTHLPSNLLLIALAFMPSVFAAGAVWVVRSTISQMDVPTRQSYVQSIVRPEERAAAAGYTTAGRSGQALGAPVTGAFLEAGGPWIAGPFVLAGSIKIVYDLILYRRFRRREGTVAG